MIIIFHLGGVTTWKNVIVLPLFLLYLPVPTRSRNEGVRPWFFSPEFVQNKTNLNEYLFLAYRPIGRHIDSEL